MTPMFLSVTTLTTTGDEVLINLHRLTLARPLNLGDWTQVRLTDGQVLELDVKFNDFKAVLREVRAVAGSVR